MLDELARDDVVQATFLEVRRVAPAFHPGSSVRAWLLGIAANLARHVRHTERRRRAHQAWFLERAAPPVALDDQVERRRLLARIAQALGSLTRDQQLAFVLCDLEQLPGVDVARALRVPAGTVWRRLHDARRALRRVLDGA